MSDSIFIVLRAPDPSDVPEGENWQVAAFRLSKPFEAHKAARFFWANAGFIGVGVVYTFSSKLNTFGSGPTEITVPIYDNAETALKAAGISIEPPNRPNEAEAERRRALAINLANAHLRR